MTDARTMKEPMLDLATASEEDFRPHLESGFTAESGDGREIELRLVEVAARPDHRSEPEGRSPFALVFQCDGALLTQGIYRLRHAELPNCELFLSPFEGGDDWCRLEAIFN